MTYRYDHSESQSAPDTNDSEVILHIPQNSMTGALSFDGFMSCLEQSLRWVLPSGRDAVDSSWWGL